VRLIGGLEITFYDLLIEQLRQRDSEEFDSLDIDTANSESDPISDSDYPYELVFEIDEAADELAAYHLAEEEAVMYRDQIEIGVDTIRQTNLYVFLRTYGLNALIQLPEGLQDSLLPKLQITTPLLPLLASSNE
jgi:predicted DNA-binding transcriptional regulator YafY